MLIIGESLNGTIPTVREAIVAHDENAIAALARTQVECGAQMLDVNAGGLAGLDEDANLAWMVDIVQSVVDVPLVLDSSNPAALRAGIKVYRGARPILSSINAEQERLNTVIPLAVEYNCGLVALCMSERGVPMDAEGRLVVADMLIERATAAGIKPEDIYLDPLVMTVAADHTAGSVFLQTLRLIRERYPEVGTFCAPSNVSFEMPQRRLLNRTFVAMITALGLKGFMVNVRDREVMATLVAAATLAGSDDYCRNYLKANRAGKLTPTTVTQQ
ncbi:methyltetrahydrofolate cobalamin methyltransferase [Paradesulfitobacterium aromaticivorans]